jgi:CPA1 family monovalent cation:H+ antiporter
MWWSTDNLASANQRKINLMDKSCEHLQHLTAADFPLPKTSGACEECVVEGTHWVALRECQACGHVGCCDSSPGRHATRHFRNTAHPVMRSVTSGERWTWCYIHEIYGRLAEEGSAQ